MTQSDSIDRFPQHRLDAYRVALELFAGVEELARSFPRGYAELKDQLRSAAGATILNIAEGANRIHHRDKAARFAIARSECGECDAAIQMVEIVRLASPRQARRLRRRADRVAAMLVGLIRREQALAE